LVGGPPGVVLHTVVDELPSGDTADMVPVALPRIGEGMVPNGVAGAIASDDIVVTDDVVVAVVPGMDEKTVLVTLDGAGTGIGAMIGCGKAGTVGGGGAGTVEPGKTLMKDASGCWENVNGAIALPFVDVEELGGSADVVGAGETDGIVPVVTGIAGVDVTGAAGVPCTICPVGAEQVTAVPGVVGSEACGTGESVVSGVPG